MVWEKHTSHSGLQPIPFSLPNFGSTPYYKETRIHTCGHASPHVQVLLKCLQTATPWPSLRPREAHIYGTVKRGESQKRDLWRATWAGNSGIQILRTWPRNWYHMNSFPWPLKILIFSGGVYLEGGQMRTSKAQGPEQGSHSVTSKDSASLWPTLPCRSSRTPSLVLLWLYTLSKLSHVLPWFHSNLSSHLSHYMGSRLSTRHFLASTSWWT